MFSSMQVLVRADLEGFGSEEEEEEEVRGAAGVGAGKRESVERESVSQVPPLGGERMLLVHNVAGNGAGFTVKAEVVLPSAEYDGLAQVSVRGGSTTAGIAADLQKMADEHGYYVVGLAMAAGGGRDTAVDGDAVEILTSVPAHCVIDHYLRHTKSTVAPGIETRVHVVGGRPVSLDLVVPGCGREWGSGGSVRASSSAINDEVVLNAFASERVSFVQPEEAVVMTNTPIDDSASAQYGSQQQMQGGGRGGDASGGEEGGEVEGDGSQRKPQKEKTFMQKYWMYIVPAAVIFMNLLGPDPGATGEQPQQQRRAAQRAS